MISAAAAGGVPPPSQVGGLRASRETALADEVHLDEVATGAITERQAFQRRRRRFRALCNKISRGQSIPMRIVARRREGRMPPWQSRSGPHRAQMQRQLDSLLARGIVPTDPKRE